MQNDQANTAGVSNSNELNSALSNEHRKGVLRKMIEYLVLALLYGGLAGSYLVLGLRIKG